MQNKAVKVLRKLVVMLPIALLFSFIFTGLTSYGTALFFAIILSVLLIFVNVFDYDRYDELKIADYLESKHEITFNFDPTVWAKIRNIFSNQLDFHAKLTDDHEDFIKVSLHSNLLKPEITATRAADKIRLRIEYRYLKFIPDNTRNYRTLKRLEKKIKTPPDIHS